MQWTSGASPSWSTISKAPGLLALDPVGVDRVDHGDGGLVAEFADDVEGLVEVAAQLEDLRPVDQRLGQLAERDVPLGDEHRAGQAGPGAEGGGRGRGVAGRRADDRLRPLLDGLGDGHGHPPVLERAGGVGPLDLEQHPGADPGRQPRRLEQRGPALEQRHDGRGRRDRQELPVLLDHAPPGQGPVVGGHAVTHDPHHASDPLHRVEPLEVGQGRPHGRPHGPRWVTKTRRAPSPPPSCSTERIETPWSPNAVVTAPRTPGRSATSRLT